MIKETLSILEEYLGYFLGKEDVKLAVFPDFEDAKKPEVAITLLRIEEETSRKPVNIVQYDIVEKDGKKMKVAGNKKSPDVDINLDILISSHAQDYKTNLNNISTVISKINSIHTDPKPANMKQASFDLLRGLNISLVNLSMEQSFSMWQTLHGKIVPAVAYKVRMLTVTGSVDNGPKHPVLEVDYERGRIIERGRGPHNLSNIVFEDSKEGWEDDPKEKEKQEKLKELIEEIEQANKQ